MLCFHVVVKHAAEGHIRKKCVQLWEEMCCDLCHEGKCAFRVFKRYKLETSSVTSKQFVIGASDYETRLSDDNGKLQHDKLLCAGVKLL